MTVHLQPEDDKKSIEIFKSGFDEQSNSEDNELTVRRILELGSELTDKIAAGRGRGSAKAH